MAVSLTLTRTDAVGAESGGAFAVLQLACAWKEDTVAIHYIQQGRAWQMPEGEDSPALEVMTAYHQQKCVQALCDEIAASAGKPLPPKVKRAQLKAFEKYGIAGDLLCTL